VVSYFLVVSVHSRTPRSRLSSFASSSTLHHHDRAIIVFLCDAGYGYAKAPVSIVREWQQFVNTFLSTRKAYVSSSPVSELFLSSLAQLTRHLHQRQRRR
jgi:hypothetical protein